MIAKCAFDSDRFGRIGARARVGTANAELGLVHAIADEVHAAVEAPLEPRLHALAVRGDRVSAALPPWSSHVCHCWASVGGA